MQQPSGQYVQFGCGSDAPDGWLNFDASPTLRLQRLPLIGRYIRKDKIDFPQSVRFGDIRDGLPVGDRSCDGVYASHVLEHLALDDFSQALKETYRILKPGGLFRLIVPDLQYYCTRYLESAQSRDPEACSDFMRSVHLGRKRRTRGIFRVQLDAMSNSSHQWMWDHNGMKAELEKHGFTEIRQARMGDSGDPAFNAVERAGRFEDACAFQCTRDA